MKQPITSPAEGETSGESVLGGFEVLIKELKSQCAEFKTEDTVLIGNCPQNVTEEEINTFFCGFATIIKLRQFTQKCLTTKVFIAKFDSAESASRSKVLNTLSLNGKTILLLQPDEKHFVDKKRVVELNGLQEHTEEVIYDHMTTFGNVSFVLKTNTVTYVVFEECSAVEASCRCDYLDQYPVTIRSVLDGASIETCILEQIDQNSSLLVDGEEEGQINNFMQLLDMENLDDYLEADEKDRSAGSEKPLLEVGNEEIIVTEDETGADNVDLEEADVAAIEERALQSQSLETIGTVLVDNRTRRILNLADNFLWLSSLPQLKVKIRKVSKQHDIKHKTSSASDVTVKKKKNEKEKYSENRTVSVVTPGEKKVTADAVKEETKKKEKDRNECVVDKKREDKHHAHKSSKQDKVRDKSSEKHAKKKKNEKLGSVEPVLENASGIREGSVKDAVTKEEIIEEDSKIVDKKSLDKHAKKKKKNEKQASIEPALEDVSGINQVSVTDAVTTKKHDTEEVNKEDSKNLDKSHKKKKLKREAKEETVDTSVSKTSDVASPIEERTLAEQQEDIEDKIKQSSESTDEPHNKKKKIKKVEVEKAETQVSKSDTKPSETPSPGKKDDVIGDQKKKHKDGNKKVFVQLTKLSAKQIGSLSTIQNQAATSQTELSDVPKEQKKYRKPGPDKAALRKHLESMQAREEIAKQSKKRALEESPSKDALSDQEIPKVREKRSESNSPQRKKMSKVVEAVEKDADELISGTKYDSSSEEKKESDTKMEEDKETASSVPEQVAEEPLAQPELQDVINEYVPDISNTVEITQIHSVVDVESEDEQPLIIDEPLEQIIANQSKEEHISERICVVLDAKSARLLKGKTHGDDLLYIDILPRAVVKLKQVVPSDFNVVRPKDHPKKTSDHPSKTQKKETSESPSVKKKEDKPEKPRKTNLDKIDSKFLPANSKLKSKIRSKTDINHKKHLPVPDLPIELKTHLNTSFKIPKRNSNVASTSIDRNASELNCLHKEPENRDNQRKRFQKERKPRDHNKNRGEWKQKRPPDGSGPAPKEREPSPVDYFDPSHDDHSPSPQRIPPTPPPSDQTKAATGSQKSSTQNENRRFDGQNRGNSKPSFQDIWNIPQKKPEVWAQPPWQANNAASNTINSSGTWDSEPVQQPLREQNSNNRQNQPADNRGSSDGPRSRDQQQRNTIDAGEHWSPSGPNQQKPVQTIDQGDSWSPGPSNRDNKAQELPRDRPFGRSRSPPRKAQQNNSISTGDMWDDAQSSTASRKQPSPGPDTSQARNRNPLLCGDEWNDNLDDDEDEPTGLATPPFDRSPSFSGEAADRSPINQRRNRSRSPGRRRSPSPMRQNRPVMAFAPDQRNFRQSREISPVRRKRSRSRSPIRQRRRSSEIWSIPGPNRSPDRRDVTRDRSPDGKRWQRSRSRSPPNRQRGAPFRGGSPNLAPYRSRSPSRIDRTLLPSEIWDSGRRSPRNQRLSPNRDNLRNTLLSEGNWDDDVGPPPRLQNRLTHDQRFPPGGRSQSRDRSLPGRNESNIDRPLLFEGNNRRWSRDRSPDRRQQSRSPSPGRWQSRRSMERSPGRRNPDFGEGSPRYQRTMDYWKAVEDQETGNLSPKRPASEKQESPIRSPEQWSPRDILEPGDKSWSPPPPKVANVDRRNTSRIDSEQLWANDPKPKYRGQTGGTYSPSSALDTISSEDECDFSNARNKKRKRLETIPLKLLKRNHSPQSKENENLIDRDTTRDSFESIPSYKELDSATLGGEESNTDKEQLDKTDYVSGNLSPKPDAIPDDKKTVLENLKQRAERLKKLEEMKLARQKLLAQIKQKSEVEPKPKESAMHVDLSGQSLDDKSNSPKLETLNSVLKSVPAEILLSTVNSLLSSVDKVFNKPPSLEPESKPILPQIPLVPACSPLPLIAAAPPVPPLPADAPPPPPPDEPPPPEPKPFIPHVWNPIPPLHPMLPIDVSQPPPQLLNPLLQPMEFPQQKGLTPLEEFPGIQTSEATRVNNPPMLSPKFLDRFRSEPTPRQNFNSPHGNDTPPGIVAPEENMFIRSGSYDFRERELQRDPRQQNWQQQQHQQRFGGNRGGHQGQNQQHHQQRFGDNRVQHDQNQQQRDPRQAHAGNIYGGNRGGRGGRFNRNSGNNFNNNQGNRFNNNNNNPGNNFNNNPGNNFNNSPGNNFDNNPGNNFNNNPGNNFNNNRRSNFDDSFGNVSSGNNFNNNQGNRFNPNNNYNFNNNPGNRVNNNRRNNFNNNFGNDSGNTFNDNFTSCDAGGNNFEGNNIDDNNFNDDGDGGNNFDNNSGNNFDNNFGNNFNDNVDVDSGNNFNNNFGSNNFNNQGNRFNNNQRQRFNFHQRNQRFNNNRFNNQQQQNFIQQQMFDEGCFDMNAMDDGNNNDGDTNWDDLE